MTEFVDESLLEGTVRRRSYYNDKDGTITLQERRDPIPEELMNNIEKFKGDGLAKITVSGAISSSHEYHKAEAFVSIQLTCNNDLGDVEKVHDVVQPFVHGLLARDHDDMSHLRDTVLPASKRLHAAPKGPEMIAGTLLIEAPVAKVAAPPQRGSSITINRGAPTKPTFGR